MSVTAVDHPLIRHKLENTVACSLLRELHFIEDTTVSRVALHYLRDKEKLEVDFLTVVDNKALSMTEVKVSDVAFLQIYN